MKTPDPPILCFLIEVTQESQRLGVLNAVLDSAKEVLRNINYDPRTKVSFIFFNENTYVLNNNNTITVISKDLPLVLSERLLFSTIDALSIKGVQEYFQDKNQQGLTSSWPYK